VNSVDHSNDVSKHWSAVFVHSRSRWHDFAARRAYEWDVIEALDQLAIRRGGGGPAYGDAASYWWSVPGGSGEWTAGGFGPHGVWINGVVPLLLVCEVLRLRLPGFATAEQVSEAAALRRQIDAREELDVQQLDREAGGP
jgi:hypothetical protein